MPPDAGTALHIFLIADVRGYTRFTQEHGDEAAGQLAARFAAVVRSCSEDRGGTLLELRGDEALVVFESARQALRAATEIQAGLKAAAEGSDPTLPIGIGLDAGEAVPLEGGFRGSALNRAARLCSQAGPGEVLASEAIIHLAGRIDGLQYLQRAAIELKGFAEPVRIVQVVVSPPDVAGGETAPVRAGSEDTGREQSDASSGAPLPVGGFLGALPENALVAREEEFGRILGAIDAVAQSTGRLVLLSGEPGAGKTRLAQEASLAVRDRGFLLAAGRCYESHQAVSFYPFLEALTTAHQSTVASVRATVAERWPILGSLLPNQGIVAPVTSGDGRDEQQRLFWAVTGWLQEMTRFSPVALFLDDLHWADTSSLELLQHLVRHTRADPVLLLGTYRSVEVGRQHPLESALLDFGREHLVEDIAVRRLSPEGTTSLIAVTLDEQDVSAEFSSLVFQQTEGNAFFVSEVLQALIERGDIVQQNGGWERRDIEEIEVPKSIRSVIGQRVSRLSSTAQQILFEASVLGQAFGFDDLLGMSDRQEQEIEASLEEATAAGLVQEGSRDGYTFNHALTQQALYGELPSRRKRRLHLCAGEALENLPERQRELRVAELARHFLEADDPERGMLYALQAGGQAEAIFAHGEAERYFRTALELAKDLDDENRLTEALEKLGTVLGIMGQYEIGMPMLEEVIETYHRTGDVTSEIRAAVQLGTCFRGKGTIPEGIVRLQAMSERLDAVGPAGELARFYLALELLFFASGRYSEELAVAERASELARQAGDRRAFGLAEVSRGTALGQLGRTQEGLDVLEQAMVIPEVEDEMFGLDRALINAGNSYERRGDLHRAAEYFERALSNNERRSNPWGVSFALSNLGAVSAKLGRFDVARRHLTRAVLMNQDAGRTSWAVYPLLEMAQVDVSAGHWDDGSRRAHEALESAERNGDLQAQLYGQKILAELDLLTGNPLAAIGRLEPLVDRQGLEETNALELLPTLAQAYLQAGDEDKADSILRSAISRAVENALNLTLLEALKVRGMLEAGQGRHETARSTFQQALTLAGGMSYPYMEATIDYEWGRLTFPPEEGKQHLEKALAGFQQLGSQKHAEQAEKAIAAITSQT